MSLSLSLSLALSLTSQSLTLSAMCYSLMKSCIFKKSFKTFFILIICPCDSNSKFNDKKLKINSAKINFNSKHSFFKFNFDNYFDKIIKFFTDTPPMPET